MEKPRAEQLSPLALAQHIARELYGSELETLRNSGNNYVWCVLLANSICENFDFNHPSRRQALKVLWPDKYAKIPECVSSDYTRGVEQGWNAAREACIRAFNDANKGE